MTKTVITIECVVVGALVCAAAVKFGLDPLVAPHECDGEETTCGPADDPSPAPSRTPPPTYDPAPVGTSVLYVYPEREQSVTVSLELQGELGTVYPAPKSQQLTDEGTQASWTVTASPDGTLMDRSGRTYPYLFWDRPRRQDAPEQGFVGAREEAVPFLEEKLAQLGLSDTEAADFISNWAPRIRANESMFVSLDASSHTQQVSYTVTDEDGNQVVPDTFIRVFMTIRRRTPMRLSRRRISLRYRPAAVSRSSSGRRGTVTFSELTVRRAKMRATRHNRTTCGEMTSPRTGR